MRFAHKAAREARHQKREQERRRAAARTYGNAWTWTGSFSGSWMTTQRRRAARASYAVRASRFGYAASIVGIHAFALVARELTLFDQPQHAMAVRAKRRVVALGMQTPQALVEVRPGQTRVGREQRRIVGFARLAQRRRGRLQFFIALTQRHVAFKECVKRSIRHQRATARGATQQPAYPFINFSMHPHDQEMGRRLCCTALAKGTHAHGGPAGFKEPFHFATRSESGNRHSFHSNPIRIEINLECLRKVFCTKKSFRSLKLHGRRKTSDYGERRRNTGNAIGDTLTNVSRRASIFDLHCFGNIGAYRKTHDYSYETMRNARPHLAPSN
ncbi:hypothetical protein PUN4_100026 [Paraburkholderia unamae]|nr:hypothetical protein PUN4_100026 [Paraburkholderia unamae]